MIENKIYCHVNGFLKWNISEKTSYIVGNKKFTGKMCILNLRNERKSISTGERRSQRERARSQLKVPIDETVGRSLGNVSLEQNLRILGVP